MKKVTKHTTSKKNAISEVVPDQISAKREQKPQKRFSKPTAASSVKTEVKSS